jgi:DNA-binding IclR family transcriptional regulator
MTESTWSRDISGVGVPLVLENGQRIVSFNCGGAAQRLSRQIMIDNLGPRLKQVVEQVRQLVVGGS